MKLAIVTHSNRQVGGVETYLHRVIPRLADMGFEISLWHEIDGAGDREVIDLPKGIERWSVADLGAETALAKLVRWSPEILYAHGLDSPALERQVMTVAPAVFFAHSYYGTCISGGKTFKSRVVKTCERHFGAACLAHYYPRSCGGWSPASMLTSYRRQACRLSLLADYRAIAVASEHMAGEYRRHGLGDRVTVVRLPAALPTAAQTSKSIAGDPLRLLFLGRFDFLKGGRFLLAALPLVAETLDRPLRLVCAGDGPARSEWENLANLLTARYPDLEIRFAGWVDELSRATLLAETDLLVVPSVWPEPFGLVGVEAGSFGVPSAAFAVGGIPEWLEEGVNGALASSDPPTASALAAAMVRCLSRVDVYDRLSRGARACARRFDLETHLRDLTPVLMRTAGMTDNPRSRVG